MNRHQVIAAMTTAAIASLILAGCAPSLPGNADWSAYPAAAYVATDDVLAAPAEGETKARAEAVLAEMRAALADVFGVDSWRQSGSGRWQQFGSNGYGGSSLLISYLSATWDSTEAVTVEDYEAALATAAEIAVEQGVIDSVDGMEINSNGWMMHGSMRSGTEYVEMMVFDAAMTPLRLARVKPRTFLSPE